VVEGVLHLLQAVTHLLCHLHVHGDTSDEARKGYDIRRNRLFYNCKDFIFQDEGAETYLEDKNRDYLRHHVQHVLF
jgi:hypothetical protein